MNLQELEEYENENRMNPRRREPGEYCNVLVVNGYFTGDAFTGQKKWYWMLENEQMFCRITRNRFGTITGYWPCYLTSTIIKQGRDIDPKDCLLV